MDSFIFYGYELISALIPFLTAFLFFRHLHKKKELAVIIIFALYIAGVYHFNGAETLYNGLAYHLELRPDQINFIPFSNDVDITGY